MERWRPVVRAEGHYEVSDLGRVRSLPRTFSWGDRWGGLHVVHRPLRMLSPRLTKGRRYITVGITVDRQTRTRSLHSVVLEAFVGPRPAGLVGCHGNGDVTDNRLVNLRWDSQASNIADTVHHGTNWQSNKTRCPRDHPLVSPNLVPPGGQSVRRTCLACSRARASISDFRKRGKPVPDLKVLSDLKFAAIMSG